MNEGQQQCEVTDEPKRRRIVLLPNMVTTASMFAGFYSISMSVAGTFDHAAWALFVAGILDMLDGRIARAMKATSAFGEQYDSMADLIAFGFAPAWLGLYWALKPLDDLGWAAAFIYLACAAIRLARFNTLVGDAESKTYFRGLPSPPAAFLMITPVLVYTKYFGVTPLANPFLQWVYLIVMICVGLLMVSNVRFRTFKDVHFRKYGPFLPLVGLVIILALLMVRPQLTLFFGSVTYLMWGLVEGGIILRGKDNELRLARREARRERRIKRKMARNKAKEEARERRLKVL